MHRQENPASGLDVAKRTPEGSAPHVEQHAQTHSIAILLPCYNEEATIGPTIAGFNDALPGAQIYVYDNNSQDETAAKAQQAGALVRRELLQGKGNVVRRMLADIDADIYLIADGDMTYDPQAAQHLIDALVDNNLDMTVGTRQSDEAEAYRRGHRLGNRTFNRIVQGLFGQGFSDIFSGYRAMSRRFAKSFPVNSSGFEIETELSIHALDLKIATGEVPVRYASRPENSFSKLNTYRDGLKILWTILKMYRALKPLHFYGGIGLLLTILSLGLGAPIVATFLETGLVPRFPTAILATGIMQLGVLSMTTGLIVKAVSEGRREAKRLRYLQLPSLNATSTLS